MTGINSNHYTTAPDDHVVPAENSLNIVHFIIFSPYVASKCSALFCLVHLCCSAVLCRLFTAPYCCIVLNYTALYCDILYCTALSNAACKHSCFVRAQVLCTLQATKAINRQLVHYSTVQQYRGKSTESHTAFYSLSSYVAALSDPCAFMLFYVNP